MQSLEAMASGAVLAWSHLGVVVEVSLDNCSLKALNNYLVAYITRTQHMPLKGISARGMSFKVTVKGIPVRGVSMEAINARAATHCLLLAFIRKSKYRRSTINWNWVHLGQQPGCYSRRLEAGENLLYFFKEEGSLKYMRDTQNRKN